MSATPPFGARPQGGPPQQWAPPAAAPPGYPIPPPGHAPHAGYPGPMTGPPPVACRVCGGAPAIACTVRGHRGLIILMQFLGVPGPFCRTCGTATLRRMTASTLALGWWGPISLIIGTPFALVSNLVLAGRLRRLPPPGPHGPQLDPGEPVYRRPAAWVPLIVVAVILVLVVVSGLGR